VNFVELAILNRFSRATQGASKAKIGEIQDMIYAKSFLVGLTALLLVAVLLVVGLTAMNFLHKAPPQGNDKAVTWDFREVLDFRSWHSWLFVLIVFGLGFYWEFRRALR
jgi:hypothetical protein